MMDISIVSSGCSAIGLGDKHLTNVPKGLEYLTALETLYLDQNQLSNLDSIWKLTTLEILDLGTNKLTHLSPQIGQLTALQVLAVNKNQLTQLPVQITRLTNLISLRLGDNLLTHIPKGITRLTDLHSLRLSDNQMTFLPANITKMGLKYITVDDSLRRDLPPEKLTLEPQSLLDICLVWWSNRIVF